MEKLKPVFAYLDKPSASFANRLHSRLLVFIYGGIHGHDAGRFCRQHQQSLQRRH
ncbi:MAG: hypothetical protein KGS72_04290 [Cyanobacteria bacterium REEB67]|nr:hypothetical protein [Cyanobacteria bacterium REEB67]